MTDAEYNELRLELPDLEKEYADAEEYARECRDKRYKKLQSTCAIDAQTEGIDEYFKRSAPSLALLDQEVEDADHRRKMALDRLTMAKELLKEHEARIKADEECRKSDEARREDRRIANEERREADKRGNDALEAAKEANRLAAEARLDSKRSNKITISVAIVSVIIAIASAVSSWVQTYSGFAGNKSSANVEPKRKDTKIKSASDAKVTRKQSTKHDATMGARDSAKAH